MNERDQYRKLNNALKYLYHHVYEIDKEAEFKFPTRKAELEPYARRMRGIIEDALTIAGKVKIVGHEMDFGDNKRKTENYEEN